MAKTIDVNELAKAINKGLEEYAAYSAYTVKTAAKNAAVTVRKEAKQNSPRNTGTYAKSWKYKKVSETTTDLTMVVYVDPPHYRLTHLLEYGHALRKGGRARAIPHIKPAEEVGRQQMIDEIKRGL